MKYKIQQLDRRHSHHELFEYFIQFPGAMINDRGPLNFSQALKWFTDTYGWTTEVSIYKEITRWVSVQNVAAKNKISTPVECNPIWSWSKENNTLRIYVRSDQELAFFCMKHQLDQ